ncbi:LysM peptidoglycan-binding domain-containing protein [Saccharopolyspora griseoalba]|uniref:LysM peptidoglycan-binding domain-containing protein n=1 Tax=Saccharopolyspora griseoalba TaxID=1431848 RepID=A0ABW2LQZ1_9PSEU
MISCGFVIMVGLFGVGGDAPGAGETAVVRVHSGDTLWGIANRVAPDADPRAVVQRIVELNGLGAPSAEVGRHLVVPKAS